MIMMSHESWCCFIPGPSALHCRGWQDTFLQKETDHTFISQAKSKFPKRPSCGRLAPALTLAFPGQIPSLPGCQNAPFILPCLPNMALETLGIYFCPKGPCCTAVCLRSLNTDKYSRSRYALLPTWSIWSRFAQGKHMIACWVWIVITEIHISSLISGLLLSRAAFWPQSIL